MSIYTWKILGIDSATKGDLPSPRCGSWLWSRYVNHFSCDSWKYPTFLERNRRSSVGDDDGVHFMYEDISCSTLSLSKVWPGVWSPCLSYRRWDHKDGSARDLLVTNERDTTSLFLPFFYGGGGLWSHPPPERVSFPALSLLRISFRQGRLHSPHRPTPSSSAQTIVPLKASLPRASLVQRDYFPPLHRRNRSPDDTRLVTERPLLDADCLT